MKECQAAFLHLLSLKNHKVMGVISETKQTEISLDKVYKMPVKLTTIRYEGKILIIANDTANWIVLENERQQRFFELLKSHSLKDALYLFNGDMSDAQGVVVQLEARQFENTEVKRVSGDRLHLYLTNACNLRCPHCYMYAGKQFENELTTDEIKKLLTLYSESGGKNVTFSGGEICMRHDLLELISHGNDCGLKIQLLTNGVLWTDEMIRATAPLVSAVQISIDGFDEEENSKIRGKGNFVKALRTLGEFITLKCHTELAVTPFYDDTLKTKIKKYIAFGNALLEKYKGTGFRIIFTGELLDGRNVKLNERQRDEYSRLMEKINNACYGEETSEDAFVWARLRKEIKENCTFGCLNVSAIGDVYLCSRMGKLKPYANIRTTDFSKIIQLSNKAKEISKVDYLKPCKDCELKYLCGGGCRIKYFSTLAQCSDVNELSSGSIQPRTCTFKDKKYLYDLMLKTNHRLFR